MTIGRNLAQRARSSSATMLSMRRTDWLLLAFTLEDPGPIRSQAAALARRVPSQDTFGPMKMGQLGEHFFGSGNAIQVFLECSWPHRRLGGLIHSRTSSKRPSVDTLALRERAKNSHQYVERYVESTDDTSC
jgi:hypothetical protein